MNLSHARARLRRCTKRPLPTLMAWIALLAPAWFAAGWIPHACAGEAPVGVSMPASAPAEDGVRAREQQRRMLQQQQLRLQADDAARRAQCMHRFLVNDCLDDAARHYRAAEAALQARQHQLDLLDREQRAEQERARVRAALAAHPAADPAAERERREQREQREAEVRQAQRERAQALPRSAGASAPAGKAAGKPTGGARGVLPVAPSGASRPLQSASQASAARAQHEQRMETMQRLQQRTREQQTGPPAPPLPVPSASGPLVLPR